MGVTVVLNWEMAGGIHWVDKECVQDFICRNGCYCSEEQRDGRWYALGR
jgi:hypothetical protein